MNAIEFRETPLTDEQARFQSRLYLLPYGYVPLHEERSTDDVRAWPLSRKWLDRPWVQVLAGITLSIAIVGAFALLWLLVA